MSSDVIDNRIPSPFRIEFLIIIISKNNCKHVDIIFDRITGSIDPEVLIDQVSNLSSAKETVLLLGFLFLQTHLSLEADIMDDSVQCWSNSRVDYFNIWRIPFAEHEDLRSSTDSTISTSLIHSTASRGKLWTSTYLSLQSSLPYKWRSEICNLCLLVCRLILWQSSLLEVEWFSDWRSRLKSRIQDCVWNLMFIRNMWWCVFRYVRNQRIEFSWTKWLRRRSWICTNVSRHCLRIPNIWRLIVGGSAIHLDHDKMEITFVGWKTWRQKSGSDFSDSVLIFNQFLNSLQFFHLMQTSDTSFTKIAILFW